MTQRALHALALSAAVSATLASSTSSSSEPARGNGVAVDVNRAAEAFQQIRATGPYRLDVRKGPGHTITISGDSNIVPLVQTRVSGGTLVITLSQPIQPQIDLVVRLSLPGLEAASVAGAVSAGVGAFSGQDLRLEVSGASSLQADGMQYGRIGAQVEGASSLSLSGRAEQTRLVVVGASHVVADAFTSGTADVEIAGVSSLSLGPCTTLAGSVSGVSNVTYHGTPESAAGLRADLVSSIQILPR